MPPEEFHEDMPNDEFREDMSPNKSSRQPYKTPMMPSYVWIIIAVGALVILSVIILIIVVTRKKY